MEFLNGIFRHVFFVIDVFWDCGAAGGFLLVVRVGFLVNGFCGGECAYCTLVSSGWGWLYGMEEGIRVVLSFFFFSFVSFYLPSG